MVGQAPHTQPPRPRRPRARGEGGLVDRVVALSVREGLKDEWTVHDAALSILDLTDDPGVLRRARARVSEVVLASPSLAGTRAVAAINVVLARLQADLDPEPHRRVVHVGHVPAQRPSPFAVPQEPHLVRTCSLSGPSDSIGEGAAFVVANVCGEHVATETGRAMLLAQELLVQTVGRARRPAHLVLTCDAQNATVYVDLAADGGVEQLATATPDLVLVEQLADDWGASCLRPGVRYWAAIALPTTDDSRT